MYTGREDLGIEIARKNAHSVCFFEKAFLCPERYEFQLIPSVLVSRSVMTCR